VNFYDINGRICVVSLIEDVHSIKGKHLKKYKKIMRRCIQGLSLTYK